MRLWGEIEHTHRHADRQIHLNYSIAEGAGLESCFKWSRPETQHVGHNKAKGYFTYMYVCMLTPHSTYTHTSVCVVPKVRHPGGSAFCWRLGLPEQTMGWLVSP